MRSCSTTRYLIAEDFGNFCKKVKSQGFKKNLQLSKIANPNKVLTEFWNKGKHAALIITRTLLLAP